MSEYFDRLQVDILDEPEMETNSADSELQLECNEEVDFASLEPRPAPPAGTEILSAQIVARRHYLKQSLGVEKEPEFVAVKHPEKPEERPRTVASPPLVRHAAEIVVSHENAWFYPPTNFDMLQKTRKKTIVPARRWHTESQESARAALQEQMADVSGDLQCL